MVPRLANQIAWETQWPCLFYTISVRYSVSAAFPTSSTLRYLWGWTTWRISRWTVPCVSHSPSSREVSFLAQRRCKTEYAMRFLVFSFLSTSVNLHMSGFHKTNNTDVAQCMQTSSHDFWFHCSPDQSLWFCWSVCTFLSTNDQVVLTWSPPPLKQFANKSDCVHQITHSFCLWPFSSQKPAKLQGIRSLL